MSYGASITNQAAGAYKMVAEATASTRFEGTATVADLWTSMPEFPVLRDNPRPKCLILESVRYPAESRPMGSSWRPTARKHGVIHFPGSFDEPLERGPAAFLPDDAGHDRSRLSAKPSLTPEPVFTFPREDGTLRTLDEIGVLERDRNRLLDNYYIVRPKVGTEAIGPPTAIMTLWALLFCLSELARYYPDIWVSALDPDASPLAVTLEEGLDRALNEAAPLIHGALGGPSMPRCEKCFGAWNGRARTVRPNGRRKAKKARTRSHPARSRTIRHGLVRRRTTMPT